MKINIYSVVVSRVDATGKVTLKREIKFKRVRPATQFVRRRVITDPQIFEVKGPQQLHTVFKKEFKLKKNEKYTMLIKTTKGRYYFANNLGA